MVPGQQCVSDSVVVIGDRCLIGRGSGIVGHLSIEIGDDVWTGHHIYITDQNHGFDDPSLPISQQIQPERPVRIGDGSWIGHGAVILPGARIGRNVVIGANSVVSGEIPDYSVAVGAPATVIRRASTSEVARWCAGGHLVVAGERLDPLADRDAVGGLVERQVLAGLPQLPAYR